MIPYDSILVICGVLFYALTKLLCVILSDLFSMYKKQHLTSIPEKNEVEEEIKVAKWVPKKKHEVLKAKYKCLKKLFQIYDASVIGILPETYDYDADNYSQDDNRHSRRKKRSHRTKTDACAGTTEVSSGDVTVASEENSIASAVIRDLKTQCSCSTQMTADKSVHKTESEEFKSPSIVTDRECGFTQTLDRNNMNIQHPIPYLVMNEQRKPTRFQLFMQRLFGLRREPFKNYVLPNGHIYAASDNNIMHTYCEKRRRRGLRFRRLRKPKKIHSEIALRELRSPTILSYVQSVQRNCLLDRTPRQCPFVGCKMIFYGIINYNDHLNLCHFPEKKFICHYCHEGFEQEHEKYVHENEHLGITKLNQQNIQHLSATSTVRHSQKASNTQTDPVMSKCDVPEEKLKKIVSFFDKIVDTEQMLTELKKDRYSESNLQTLNGTLKTDSVIGTETESMTTSDKRTVSCGNLMHRKMPKNAVGSEMTSNYACAAAKCHICGENFDFRRQLSLHMDLEHRVHDKFSKFHSCAGIVDYRRRFSGMVKTEAGKLNIQSINDIRGVNTSSTLTPDSGSELSRRKSEETLSCDPSTNIIYYESLDSVKKPSVINNFVGKVRSGMNNYRWEPGTKIIRV